MPLSTHSDPFGFKFWLKWIFSFVGSFLIAAVFWTVIMTLLFREIRGNELTLTWALAVFGSWFILVIPFMRKKEQIWKRLNVDQEKAVDAWLQGVGTLIGAFIVSSLFWSWIYREAILNSPHSFLHPLWAKAVFGTWLVCFLPFLVWMYKSADRIFKSAVIRQSRDTPLFQTAFHPKEKRTLPTQWSQKIKNHPETLSRGHVVSLRLKDGREIPHVFILDSKEILGIYDRQEFDFGIQDIDELDVMKPEELVAYDPSKWLRLDVKI